MTSTDDEPTTPAQPTDHAPVAAVHDTDHARALIGTRQPVRARILEPIPGGYHADIGVPAVFRGRGNWKHERRHVDLTGTSLDAEVVDIDEQGRPVVSQVVTGADADGFARAQRVAQAMRPGQRRQATVRTVVEFGAFVTVDGIDGLVHASEMRPDERFEPGQSIEVEVLAVDVPLVRASFRPAR